jgi:predicted ATP-grasp superfamily ATP-dependent carboligase
LERQLATPRLLIAGFSTRAAAQSARRAGFEVLAVDAFGDRDLLAAAERLEIVSRYPQDIEAAQASLPAAPWLYVGGLENEPALVARISEGRQLLGAGANLLRRVRDPFALAAALQAAALHLPRKVSFPETRCDAPAIADGRRWLWKRLKSAGGLGIRSYRPGSDQRYPVSDAYFQRELFAGVPLSAGFVAAKGRAVCFGFASGILGRRWGTAFWTQYTGSIAHRFMLWPGAEESIAAVGRWVAAEFGLTGLFGLDFVAAEDQLWLLEVNPRYCASFELFERGWNLPLLRWHYEACTLGQLPESPFSAADHTLHGKLIVYATQDCRIGSAFEEQVTRWNAGPWPDIADIPQAGAMFRRHEPIATVFAMGDSNEQIRHSLDAKMQQVRAALEPL